MSKKEGEMVKTVPFDTLAYAKKLEAHGVEARQAEAHAEALVDVLEGNFPTKQDANDGFLVLCNKIDHVYTQLDTKIDNVRTQLDTKIDNVRTQLDAKIDNVYTQLDTKIDNVRTQLDAKIDNLRNETYMKLAETKADIIKWVFGISLAQAALIVSLLKFFH